MVNSKVHSLERTRRCSSLCAVIVLQWWPKPYRVDGVAKLQPSGAWHTCDGCLTACVWSTDWWLCRLIPSFDLSSASWSQSNSTLTSHRLERVITGPPNGPVLFCSLASVVCRRLKRCRWAGRPPGASVVGRPTLHGGPVRLPLRPVRATPCFETCSVAPTIYSPMSTLKGAPMFYSAFLLDKRYRFAIAN